MILSQNIRILAKFGKNLAKFGIIWQNLGKIAILNMDNYDIVSKHQNFDKKRKKFGKIWKKLAKFGKIWQNLEKIAILNMDN